MGDLDGDGTPEIVIGIGEPDDNNTSQLAAGGVAAFEPDGRLRWHRHISPNTDTGDTQVFSTPAIGDIDGDGRKDVVVGSYNHKIYALDSEGELLPGWPFQTVDTTWSSPSLVDLDHDGKLSIVIGSDYGFGGAPTFGCISPPTNGLLFVLQSNGTLRPGWPKCLTTPIWSSPAVVDLLGDGVPTAVFGTNNFIGGNHAGHYFAYAYRLTDGSTPPGWPVQLAHAPNEQAFSSPAVADLDGDGKKEVAIGSTWDMNAGEGSLYLIGADGRIRWRKDYTQPVLGSPVVADLDGDGRPEVALGTGDINVYGYHADGSDAFSFRSQSFIFNSPFVADLDGDGVNEMVVASGVDFSPPKVWVVETAGRTTANLWPTFRRTVDRLGTDLAVRTVAPRHNFDEYLLLANAGDTAAHATVTLQLPSDAPIKVPLTVGPHTRYTFPVDSVVPDSEVSARVDSDAPVAAERAMYFRYGPSGWTGGHDTHGATAPATDWFLAEGYTALNFDTYVLMQNPGSSDADAVVTLMKPDGTTNDVGVHLPAQTRRTVNVKSVAGYQATEVSFRVHATAPVVVERSMYFDYDGKDGGHDALGATSLSSDWFLAEGYTGQQFDTYVLVANPNDAPAHVTYTFLLPDRQPVVATRDVAPRSRATLKVDDVPGLGATEVSTKVTADVPIAVERAMYFDYQGRTGGHDAEGVVALGSDWFLAEGYTGSGFDTYLLLANPSADDADVDLAYLLEDGSVRHQTLVVPAQSRRTVRANDAVPDSGFSTHVTVANGVGISVERAMYFLYAGMWDGGHDAQAVPSPSRTWYFAEGYTGR